MKLPGQSVAFLTSEFLEWEARRTPTDTAVLKQEELHYRPPQDRLDRFVTEHERDQLLGAFQRVNDDLEEAFTIQYEHLARRLSELGFSANLL